MAPTSTIAAIKAQFGGSISLAVFTLAASFWIVYLIVSRLALYSSRRRFQAQNGCQPVYRQFPSRWFGINFILKNGKDFREHKYLEALDEQFKSIGLTHEVQALGGTSIWTIEPENVKAILATNFKDYSNGNRPAVMGPLLGNGIFVSDGESWTHSRSLLRPNFAKEQIADLEMIEKHMRRFLDLIPGNNETIDLQELIHRFTMDSSTEFLFDASTETLISGAKYEFSDAFKYSQDHIAAGLRLGPFAKFRPKDKKAIESHRICRQHIDNYVQQALEYRRAHLNGGKGAQERRTFLRELALATEDRERLRDELLSLLLAGRDTTASLIGSVLFCLAKNPQAWRKVREEIANVTNGAMPSYEQLRDLKYTKWCVNETLRLYPPVPLNAKTAIRDTVLPRGGGPDGKAPIFVPQGAFVCLTVYAMHRRKDIFGPDAEEYKPERWENQKYTWEYLPFNGGPRICLGQQYATTETLYFVARFVQEFETMESRDDSPWVENLTITMCSFNGIKVALRRENE